MKDRERVGAQIQGYMQSSGQRDRRQDTNSCALERSPAPLKNLDGARHDNGWLRESFHRGFPNALKTSALQGYNTVSRALC